MNKMHKGKKISGGKYVKNRKKKSYEIAGQKKIVKIGKEKRMENREEVKTKTPKEKYDAEMKEINKTISPNTPEGEAGLSGQDVEDLDEECEAVEEAMDKVEFMAGGTLEETREFHSVDKSMGDEPCTKEEFDKSMGDIKESTTSTMTQDQHLDAKIEGQRDKVLKQFTGIGAKQERLTPDQQKKMTRVLELAEGKKIKDPVLLHLVNKKLDLVQEQAVMATEIKKVQLEVIERMSDLADRSLKAKGAAEHYNRDILLYVQKNPTLLAE